MSSRATSAIASEWRRAAAGSTRRPMIISAAVAMSAMTTATSGISQRSLAFVLRRASNAPIVSRCALGGLTEEWALEGGAGR